MRPEQLSATKQGSQIWRCFMNGKRLWSIARIFAALTLAVSSGALAWAPTPEHFRGTISDYTPLNSIANPTGPYEMRGHWSLDLKRDGKADFSAFMTWNCPIIGFGSRIRIPAIRSFGAPTPTTSPDRRYDHPRGERLSCR
jgi:hypothetical protein